MVEKNQTPFLKGFFVKSKSELLDYQKYICKRHEMRKYFLKHSNARQIKIDSDEFFHNLWTKQTSLPQNSNSYGSENAFETAVASKLKKF